jgi:hypothetical protein
MADQRDLLEAFRLYKAGQIVDVIGEAVAGGDRPTGIATGPVGPVRANRDIFAPAENRPLFDDSGSLNSGGVQKLALDHVHFGLVSSVGNASR